MDTKLCGHCHLIKPLEELVADKNRKDGYRNICRACIRVMWANRTNEQREGTRVRFRKWRETHRQQARATTSRWAKRHPQYMNEKAKHWAKTPQGRYSRLRASAKKRGISFLVKRDDFIQWFIHQDMQCFYCHQGINPNDSRSLQIDRQDNNGDYTLNNMVFSCWRCNRVKGDVLTAEEMLAIARNHFL